MKNFTLFWFCLIPNFISLLHAAPMRPNFSIHSDTLSVEMLTDTMLSLELSTETVESAAELPPVLVSVIGDFCGQGTGSIDISPDPNTPGPWTFIWSNGATTEDITGLSAGTYTVHVTDANGNQQALQVMVGDLPGAPAPVTHVVATPNTVCVGSFNGALDLTATPLTAPWTYLWSTGATTQDISGLNSGTYTVTITVGVTCSTTHEFWVPDNAGVPIAVAGAAASSCERPNGLVAVEPTFLPPGTTYLWSNGSTEFAQYGMYAGTYTVTITLPSGCTNTYTVTVLNDNWPILPEDQSIEIIPNTLCVGGNGSISIPIVHPILHGPFDFQWSNGATTQTISNLPSGDYEVTITFNPACFSILTYTVPHEPLIPGLHFTNTPTTCGLQNGFVNLTMFSGGTPPYTYLWSNGATTQDLMNVLADTYDVTITGTNGCPIIASAIIEDTPVLFNYSALVTDNNACDTTNGQINLSLFPGTLGYQWSNGATGTILRNLAPGDYTVTISAGGTCTAVETYSVGEIPEYPIIPLVPNPSTCGLSNGSVDLSLLGQAEAPLRYLWSNGATTQDLAGIPAGTYSVTVTSAVGCATLNVVTVPSLNDTITVLGNVLDDFSCNAPTGNISLNVAPTDSSYTYVWSNGATTDSLSNLTAGTYMVTVTLGLSCIVSDTFVILDNAQPPNLTDQSLAAHCSLNNGATVVSVTGGTAPFRFLWSTLDTTALLNNLPPGTYTVTVTGANDCTAEHSVTILDDDASPTMQGIATENTSCSSGNGTLELSVSPAGTYQYLWSNGAVSEDLNNLDPGSYTVTVSLGTCLSSSTFFISDNAQPPNLSTTTLAANCGLNDGAASVSVTNGTGPYTYFWSTSATDPMLSDLLPGTYLVTVEDSLGCAAQTSVVVQDTDIPLDITASAQGNTSCTEANGTLELSVSPAGTYQYLWSNGAVVQDLSDLVAGTYTVSVSLGNCQSLGTFSVSDHTETPDLSADISAAICSADNGSIDLSVSGTAGPFTFLWSNMATMEDVDTLLPGDYSVTVTAPNGCTQVTTLNVPNNAPDFSLSGIAVPLTDCATDNGAIDLDITFTGGGTFTYLWSNMATTEDINSLLPGSYTVSVTQSGSCTATASYVVTDQRSIPSSTLTIAPEFCGLSDGNIDLSLTGGTAPFLYQWESGQTSQNLNGLVQGTYTVTVTDANNCTVSAIAVVPENTVSFTLSGASTPNSSCIQNNGALDLTVTGNGTFSYLWSNFSLTEDLQAMPSGIYTVTVSAGGNCTHTAVFVISSDVPSPILSSSIVPSFCGQTDGGINLNVSGSPAPHQFLWSNAALVEDLDNLIAGDYAVTVTAANGCTSIGQYTVTETVVIPDISGSVLAANSCLAFNGAIDLTVGFVAGYTVLWSNGSQVEDPSGLAPGAYTVTVNGGAACVGTANFNIADETNQPLASIVSSTDILDCITQSSNLVGGVTGTSNATALQWVLNGSQIGIGSTLVVSVPGEYQLIATDEFTSCADTTSIYIGQNQNLPDLAVVTPGLLTCTNPIQTLVGSSLTTGIQFAWATIFGTDTTILGNSPMLEVNAPGTFVLLGQNPSNHCSNAVLVTVSANQNAPLANAGQAFQLDCVGETASLNGSGSGAANLVFQWNSPDGHLVSGGSSPTPLIDEPGTYMLLVTNPVNGCTATDVVVIETEIPVAYASVTQPSCLAPWGTARVDSVTGLSGTVWYSLDNGQSGTHNQFSNLEPGVYTLTVMGGNGCNATTVVSVVAQVPLEISLEPTATIVLGYSYQLEARLNILDTEVASVQWTPVEHLDCGNCLSTLASPLVTTRYEVLVESDEGCKERGSILLVVDKTRRVYSPNIFSPDGDGNNDIFTIFADPVTVESIRSLQVFTRWGEAVYEQHNLSPDDASLGWDGTFRGQKMNPGVFVWKAVVRFVDGQEEGFVGDVTLKR
jgi:gliding motility-associated-like protein